jgi:DNA-binding NarL/FixJ family response regulator
MLDEPIKVLCVDDNDMVAEAIRIKVRMAEGVSWLGRLADAGNLVETARELCPDVVLLDIDMPGKDAFVALEELASVCPEARVLMLSGHVRADLLDRAVEAGAWGYISKGDGIDSIIEGIRLVATGQFAMGPNIKGECGRMGAAKVAS